MPFKARLKASGNVRKRARKRHAIDWSSYNAALKQRGSIHIWFSEDIASTWYASRPDKLMRGRPYRFSDAAITLCLILGKVCKQRLQQTEGFVQSLIDILDLDLVVPNYSTYSRRGSCPLQTCQLKKLEEGEDVYIVVDSTGLKVFGESEWLETKHGKQYTRKCWRKLHIGINQGKYFVSRVLTTHHVDDGKCVQAHLQQVGPAKIKEFIADSGYDGEPTYQLLDEHGIKAVIPPPSNAKSSKRDTARDKTIAYIQEKGLYAWQTKNDYGRRAHGENAFNRYKTVIGPKLNSREFINQDADTHLGCFIMNKFTDLGMPTPVKNP